MVPMKKNAYKAATLALSIAFITTPLFASAQTTDASSSVSIQIQSLLSQIIALQQQLKMLVHSSMGTSTMPTMGSSTQMHGDMHGDMGDEMSGRRCVAIIRDLSMGSQGDDVSNLQQMLSDNGFLSASNATGFFGALTAHAVMQFQSKFGVSASTTGVVGPLTRNVLRGHCGDGMNGGMSPTSHSWQNGTSTHWMSRDDQGNGGNDGSDHMNNGTSTDGHWMHPGLPGILLNGSTTMPVHPCMDGHNGTSTVNNAASALLFVAHAIMPGMQHPCQSVSGEMEQR